MVIEIAKVRKARESATAEATKSGPDAARLLELQYIADAHECIRGELAGLSNVIGIQCHQTTLSASQPPRAGETQWQD